MFFCASGEMADTLDLGSSAFGCKGSSPFLRTTLMINLVLIFFFNNNDNIPV